MKYTLFCFLAVFISLSTYAQDYIKPKTGETIIAQIVSVDAEKINFKLIDATDTTLYFMSKEGIEAIGFSGSFLKDIQGNVSSLGSELIKSASTGLKDYLILKDETITAAKIDSVTDVNIYFHLVADTSSYFIDKQNSIGIVFSNKPIVFNKKKSQNKYDDLSDGELYRMGVTDAHKYYKGYKAAATASFLVSWTFYGLAVPIVSSIAHPADYTLNYPDIELMQKSPYATGYRKTARNIKAGKVWSNAAYSYGAALGVIIVFAFVIATSYR
jgi:hypothetical protein